MAIGGSNQLIGGGNNQLIGGGRAIWATKAPITMGKVKARGFSKNSIGKQGQD